MFRYYYEVRNASADIVKTFGSDYHAAKRYARENEKSGRMYGLHVVKYRVSL